MKANKAADAIAFWDDQKVRDKIELEKDSNIGLLRGVSNIVGPSLLFNEELIEFPVRCIRILL